MNITETEHLVLRRFQHVDAEALCLVLCDAEVMVFSNGVKTPEGVREWLERCQESYSKRGFGLWAVVEKRTKTIIGYCGLIHFPDIDGRPEVEIGFRLARCAWGHGHATEAVTAVRDLAFYTLGLSRLVAMVDPENTASIRVIEKLGMHYEKDVMFPGYDHEDRLYSIHRDNG